MAEKFAGFGEPKENWSRLPHVLIDELSNITSEAELKVILYILRHTWGYQDADKRITNDEFCKGRKRKDGTRIDAGCGISRNSIRSGIEKAVEHGYIVVEEDSHDLARISRWYALASDEESRGSEVDPRRAEVDPRRAEVDPRRAEVDPRTEKETIRNKPEKETIGGLNSPPPAEAKAEEAALLERQRAAGVALPHPGIEEPWWKAKGRAYKLCPEFEPKIHGELYAALQKATGREALIATSGELSDKAAGEVQRATVALYGMGYQTVEQLRELYRAYKQKHPKTTLPRPEWLTDFGSRLKTEQENKHGQNGNGHGGGTGEAGGGFATGNGGAPAPALDPAIAARFQKRREQRAAQQQ